MLLAASLFIFTYPLGDDFIRAWNTKKLGLLSSIQLERAVWSGRWASTSLAYLTLGSINFIRYYGVILLFFMGFFAICLHLLFCTMLRTSFQSKTGLLTTLSFLSIYWAGMPSLGEMYWLPGALEYHASIAIIMLSIACLIRTGRKHCPLRSVLGITGTIAAFLAPGMHELLGVMLFIILIGGFIIAVKTHIPGRLYWLLAIIGAILGGIWTISAPGNAIRSGYFPDRYNIGLTISITGTQVVSYFPGFIADIKLWSGSVIIVLLNLPSPECIRRLHCTGIAQRIFPGSRPKWIGWIIIPWLILMGIILAVPSWAMGIPLPGRTKNVLYFTFLVGWFLAILVTIRNYQLRHTSVGKSVSSIPDAESSGNSSFQKFRHKTVLKLALIVWVLALIFTRNTINALDDLFYRGWIFKKTMIQRDAFLRHAAAKGLKDVYVTYPPVWPHCFNHCEASNNPAEWVNQALARYYGVTFVTLSDKQIAIPTDAPLPIPCYPIIAK